MLSIDVVFSATMLAMPKLIATVDNLYRYIDGLLGWAELLEEPWVVACILENASDALIADDMFPCRMRLQKLFEEHQISEYDVNTVFATIGRVMARTASYESHSGIRDVLHENLTTTPDVISVVQGVNLSDQVARSVLIAAISRWCLRSTIRPAAVFLPVAPAPKIDVSALLHICEHELGDVERELVTSPDYFVQDVTVCDGFEALVNCLNESEILRNADGDEDIVLAIRIGLFKSRRARNSEVSWSDTLGIRLGVSFGASIRRCCQDGGLSVAASAIRAVCETVDAQSLQATHAIREGRGGNSRQVVRKSDNATAWRRDINNEYHLHYWDCNGAPEFAQMNVHNDFTIPQ